ncbi:MAG TPA: HAD family phosphatase [Casimicrobiaceae bacterium]|jgi:HAD superfamily hydrolase (TIGR01509 family)|nr:HAD family phosphatase [Casimicrobiaceae bacterium]
MPPTPTAKPAFLFDLDGTLIDSVYEHVLAWREALREMQIELSTWRIHRRVGMSDGLMVTALQRETGRKLTKEETERLKRLHSEAFLKRVAQVRPLPGARELLSTLSRLSVPWAIATSGVEERAREAVKILDVGPEVQLITRNDVAHGKPFPDLFLAGAKRLKVDINDCIVVGDSIWDLLAARRARALGVGLLCGGYGQDELVQAGAYRVYEDPVELTRHIDELGVQADL